MTTPPIGIVDTQETPEICSIKLLDITDTTYMEGDVIIGQDTLGRVINVTRTFRHLLPGSHDNLFLTVQLDNPAHVLGEPVRLTETSRSDRPAYPSWPNIESFYVEGGGARSGECDYGIHNWIRYWQKHPTNWDRWRVSVVAETGNVYASNNRHNREHHQVVLLGAIRPLPEDHLRRGYSRDPEPPVYVAAE